MSNKNVLVGVLKSKGDLDILLHDHWYRIPVAFAPKKKFKYVAFYQPEIFGKEGKQIKYFARVISIRRVKRLVLLPNEPKHKKADDYYYKIKFKKIEQLESPIKNIIPRRISFGFTSLKDLESSRNILELYHVPATEKIIERGLRSEGIKTIKEFTIINGEKRYRVDLVILCKKGKIAIECDNDKAHNNKKQKEKDKAKDLFLRRHSWKVIRLSEKEIIENLDQSILKIKKYYTKFN